MAAPGKPRRFWFYPSDFISGVTRQMNIIDLGVYWLICTICYDRNGYCPDDHIFLAGLLIDTDPRTVRAAIERLVKLDKLQRTTHEPPHEPPHELSTNRVRTEHERSLNRSRRAHEASEVRWGDPSKRKELSDPTASGVGYADVMRTDPHSDTKTVRQSDSGGKLAEPEAGIPPADTQKDTERVLQEVVDRYLGLRAKHWPKAMPGPGGLTLKEQARDGLKAGCSGDAMCEVLDRAMAAMARKGRQPPLSIRSFQRQFEEAVDRQREQAGAPGADPEGGAKVVPLDPEERKRQRTAEEEATHRANLDRWIRTGVWAGALGSPPDDEPCYIPKHILDERRAEIDAKIKRTHDASISRASSVRTKPQGGSK